MNAIETLKAICEARGLARYGKWERDDLALGGSERTVCCRGEIVVQTSSNHHSSNPDAQHKQQSAALDFIALAGSTDWPALLAEVERLQAIVDKLPRTDDEVPVTSGDDVYELLDGKTIVHGKAGRLMWPVPWPVFSTREAAEAAAKGKDAI